MPNNPSDTQFLFQAVVLDDNDPMMLGRVRARVLTDDYNAVIESISNPSWNEERDAWTSRDPFIFASLLPYFVYSVPKKDELIYVFYYNKGFKFQSQFFIQALFSSPTTSPGEYYAGYKNTGLGGQFKNLKPLKNRNGTYSNNLSKGVFPEPGDNSLLGRGSADLIVQEDTVLLRAGKNLGQIAWNVMPTANNGRAFLQLSKFDNLKIIDDVKEFTESKENVVLVKYLIEWTITNPENQFDRFTGVVYLYKLKPNIKTNSKELKVDSDIEEYKNLVTSWGFNALSKRDTIDFINNFIKSVNDGGKLNGKKVINESPFPVFYRPTNAIYNFILQTSSEPLVKPTSEYWSYGTYFFLFGSLTVDIKVLNVNTGQIIVSKSSSCSNCTVSKKDDLWKEVRDLVNEELEILDIENVILPTSSDLIDSSTGTIPTAPPPVIPVPLNNNTAQKNLNEIFKKIKLNNSALNAGYGLIYKKDTVGQPNETTTTEIPIFKNTGTPLTFGALGADKLVFISHQSSKVGIPKINMDGTLYGITNDNYTDEILPKTSSMVRGEELLELLNLIVRFLSTHTHAFPGLPPVPVSQDGSNIANILAEMQNAFNKVLNQNIRIN